MIEVILLERIEKLGFMGDVVKVRDGYARNFLLPQKKALRKTKSNMEYFNNRRAELEAINLKRKDEAAAAGEKIDGMSLISVQPASEGGQLYGSVSARDVAEMLRDQGVTIARGQVQLNQPIKTLGQYDVKIGLHPEVVVTVSVTVARTQQEAEAQIAGIDLDPPEEDDAAEAQEFDGVEGDDLDGLEDGGDVAYDDELVTQVEDDEATQA